MWRSSESRWQEDNRQVATRVEAAQEGQDEEMTEAPAASSARSVRPRSAETSSRTEGVLPSRNRGSEEVGPADESQIGISEWQ